MSQAGRYQNQSSGIQVSINQSSGNQSSANRSSINQSSVNADCKPRTLEKPENIAPKFPVYVLGECFITIYESILNRYGMMDENALRLPECLSLPALSLYLSLPEGVRSNYTQTVAALKKFWPAPPGVANCDDLNENYGLPVLKQGHDSLEIFAPKVCSVAPLQMDLIGWQNICCGKVCLLTLVFGLTNVMMISSLLLIFIYSVGDC